LKAQCLLFELRIEERAQDRTACAETPNAVRRQQRLRIVTGVRVDELSVS
jgi:hypothetical protein